MPKTEMVALKKQYIFWNIFLKNFSLMAIWNSFKDFISETAGVVVNYVTKTSASIVNCNKKHLQIQADIKNKIVSYFPTIDLSKVRIIKNVTLPANWFERRNTLMV